jgi:hypothetical protein
MKVKMEMLALAALALMFGFVGFDSIYKRSELPNLEKAEIGITMLAVLALWSVNESSLTLGRKGNLIVMVVLSTASIVATANIYLNGYQSSVVSSACGSWPVMMVGALGLWMLATTRKEPSK